MTGPGDVGVVVGRIHACSGLRRPRPPYVGGTVTALRRRITYVTEPDNNARTLLPTGVVARQVVPPAGFYRFSVPAGAYVIDLRATRGGDATTDVAVVVHTAVTTRAVLPNRFI